MNSSRYSSFDQPGSRKEFREGSPLPEPDGERAKVLLTDQAVYNEEKHAMEGGDKIVGELEVDFQGDSEAEEHYYEGLSRQEFVLDVEKAEGAEESEKTKPYKPSLYRKKPVTIEAMRWDGSAEGATPIIDWVLDGGGTARYSDPQPETRMKGKVVREAVPALLSIDTLEGVMRAIPGDWIIRGVQGEFYPCKPDIFEMTYDVVESTDE